AEKFMDIKAVQAGFKPNAVVIVATARALKMHGGVDKKELKVANPEAITAGMQNLAKHVETVRAFGVEPIVALNRFITDTQEELDVILNWGTENGVKIALTNVWEQGGAGGLELAQAVLDVLATDNHFKPIYDLEDSVEN